MYNFQTHWGTSGGYRTTEKFLIFFIVKGREVPLYALVKSGIIKENGAGFYDKEKTSVVVYRYQTPFREGKIFMSESGFGVNRNLSLYFSLLPEEKSPEVTIRGIGQQQTSNPFMFISHLHFLKPSEALELLDPSEQAVYFIKQQMKRALPVELIKSLITVDRSYLTKGVRKIRF